MASEDDTAEEKANWHWRNSMRPARFFNLDARAALPFFLLLVYARPITFWLTIVIVSAFYFLERRELPLPAALRSFRVWLIGKNRPGWSSHKHRRFVDKG